MPKIGFLTDESFYVWGLFALLLAVLLFRAELGIIYVIIFLASIVTYIFLGGNSGTWYKLNSSRGNTAKQIVNGIVFFIIFAAISILISGVFSQSITSSNPPSWNMAIKAFSVQNQPSYAPILADNAILTFVVYALLIPIIETVAFFGRGLEFLIKQFGVTPSLTNPRLWAIFVIISILFTYAHFAVRGVNNISGNLITFLFGMFSCFLVVKTRELEGAVNAHVIWNGAIMVQRLGWL